MADESPRDYRPDWQCQGCGEVVEEALERCPVCGGETFRAIER